MAYGISQLENRNWTFKQNIIIEGDMTVDGDFTFGDASTDSLGITGHFVQTSNAVTDGHTVDGSGALTAGQDLARFTSTGNISSTSNVLAVEQNTGAGVAGAYGIYVNCTGTNVEAIRVDAGNVVFDEALNVVGTITGGTVTDGTLSSTAGTVTGGVSITATTLTDGTATMTAGALASLTTVDASGAITGGTITDGTLTSTAGTATGGVSITSTTFTDGTATLTGGDITGAGSITATTLTDGTFSVTAGAITGVTTIGMTGDLTCNGGDASVIESDDGAVGAEFNLQQISASPTANDQVGLINFIGRDLGAGDNTYGAISGVIMDATAGAEFGAVGIGVQNGTGSLTNAASFSHNGAYGQLQTGLIANVANIGAAGTNVVATEYGDGFNHTTILTLTNADLGAVGGAGNLAIGALIYTFPAGAHVHSVTSASVSLQGDAAVQGDTPDVGIGSVIGSGNVAVLGGTPQFEDYIVGSAAADVNGTPTVNAMSLNTAGTAFAGISFNAVGDSKALNYSAAVNWSGASTAVLATGIVVIQWAFHG